MVLFHDYNLDKVIVEYQTQQRAQASRPHRARTLWEHTWGLIQVMIIRTESFYRQHHYHTPHTHINIAHLFNTWQGFFLKVMIIYIRKHIFRGVLTYTNFRTCKSSHLRYVKQLPRCFDSRQIWEIHSINFSKNNIRMIPPFQKFQYLIQQPKRSLHNSNDSFHSASHRKPQ